MFVPLVASSQIMPIKYCHWWEAEGMVKKLRKKHLKCTSLDHKGDGVWCPIMLLAYEWSLQGLVIDEPCSSMVLPFSSNGWKKTWGRTPCVCYKWVYVRIVNIEKSRNMMEKKKKGGLGFSNISNYKVCTI